MKKTKGEIIELIKQKFELSDDSNFSIVLGPEIRNTKIFFKCILHGVSKFYWSSTTGNDKFLGCKKCRNINKWKDEFISELEKDNCILVGDYIDARTPTSIKCLNHKHIFMSSRNAYLSKNENCPKCRKDENREKWKNIFIEKSIKLHKNYYDYSNVVYTTVMDKVEIICPKHGPFYQTPDLHLQGQKCLKCVMSYPENNIKLFLEEMGISYIHGKGLKILTNPETGYPLKPDFYLPEYNLVIEYDGIQHFEPKFPKEFEKTKKLDKLKNDLCLLHNVNIWRFNKDNVHLLKDKLTKLNS
jgi:hypothetical protein